MAAVELYAFWRYDQYPYVLHGEVAEMKDDGGVTLKSYAGMYVKPLLLLPLGSGRQVGEQIDKLRADYKEAKLKLKETWRQNAAVVLPSELKPGAEEPTLGSVMLKWCDELAGEISKDGPVEATLREKVEQLAAFFRAEAEGPMAPKTNLLWCAEHVEKLLKSEEDP